MHFTALLPLVLALSASALPVPRPRHVQGIDVHPQAKVEPTPSAAVGEFPSPSPMPPAGKMTNAQRMAMGLGPNAPTRRSTAPRRRASPVPVSNTNQDSVIQVISQTGDNLGTVTDNGNGDTLMTFTPGGTPLRFTIPKSAGPFELAPSGDEGGLFGRARRLLGAIPHRPDASGSQLGPGSPNFANIGQDPSNPLGLSLPPLPAVDSAGGVFSGLPSMLAKVTGGSGGGLGGLLNVVGPLNILGGGGSNDGVDDASSSGTGLLGLQLPDGIVPEDDLPFAGSPQKLASTLPIPESMLAPMNQPAQSSIWTCDAVGNMGAMWKNPSGETIPATFFTGGPCAHTICLTADLSVLKSVYGDDVKGVKLVAGVL